MFRKFFTDSGNILYTSTDIVLYVRRGGDAGAIRPRGLSRRDGSALGNAYRERQNVHLMYVPYACACTGKKNKIAASLDIEAWLVSRHGTETRLTNLSLNRLYFFAQVKSLRSTGMTVIGDPIEAWTQGKDTPDHAGSDSQFGGHRRFRPRPDVRRVRETGRAPAQEHTAAAGKLMAVAAVTMSYE